MNLLNRIARAVSVAGFLVAVAALPDACSSSSPTPPPATSTSDTAAPSSTKAAAKYVSPELLSKYPMPKPITSKAAATPTVAPIDPKDFKGLAKAYAPDIAISDEPSLAVEKGEMVATYKVKLTNTLPRTVNVLKIAGTLVCGMVYNDSQTITPLVDASGAKKVLAKNGGTLTFDVAFKHQAVTPEQVEIVKKTPAIENFTIVELGFAD